MDDRSRQVVRQGYDNVGEAYLAARPTDGADMVLLRELLSRLTAGSTVLDAGCGAGVPVMTHLHDGGSDTVGLDCSHRQLTLARSHVPTAGLVQGDLGALPLRPRSVDAVVSFYAIIHVPRSDHHLILDEIHRVLRPGGLALLCLGAHDLPEDHDPESWLGTAMYWSHYDTATNLRLLHDAHLDVITDRFVPDPMGHGGHLFALARVADPVQGHRRAGSVRPTTGAPMTSTQNKATVQRLWDALYERHDFDEVGSLFAPDGYYCDMPHPEQGATGPAEIAARLRLGLANLSDHTHDIECLVAEDDTVVTEHTEHWFFPTGERVSLPFVSMHRFRDGQIVLWRDYWNWDTLMNAVPGWWLEEIAAGYR